MTTHHPRLLHVSAFVALLLFFATTAAHAAAALPALDDTLRLDPAVRTGTLPNGQRYSIRHDARPAARVSVRLAVAVGSTAEASDQRALAHFTEHMEFNGSEHFRPEELMAYLQSVGMKVGADANAYTSFDETVYMLEVPSDRDTLLDRASAHAIVRAGTAG